MSKRGKRPLHFAVSTALLVAPVSGLPACGAEASAPRAVDTASNERAEDPEGPPRGSPETTMNPVARPPAELAEEVPDEGATPEPEAELATPEPEAELATPESRRLRERERREAMSLRRRLAREAQEE